MNTFLQAFIRCIIFGTIDQACVLEAKLLGNFRHLLMEAFRL